MWTGEEGGYREGGIIWKIDTKIIESVHYNGFADYYIFGDYSGLSKKWSIIAHISKNALSEPDETFILKGSSEDDLYKKLSELAEKINKKLSKVYVLNQAEDIVRDYMGNLFNYDAAVEKMSSIVKKNPDLIQLHALLLDLYLKEKNNMDKAAHEALRIIDMYDPSYENEVRYILSLSLDPFDVIAREYEAEKKWTETIEVRNRALMIFPANMSVHKNKLGEAYYFEALSYETMGSKEKANINYNNALKYLNPSSEYYGPAAKGFSEGGQP
jgi:tetratricopeptide (TPR) repeat protein